MLASTLEKTKKLFQVKQRIAWYRFANQMASPMIGQLICSMLAYISLHFIMPQLNKSI